MEFKKTIELQYDNLKATALCKAKNDVRFYLTGIYIGDGFVAATNGHMALIDHSAEKTLNRNKNKLEINHLARQKLPKDS